MPCMGPDYEYARKQAQQASKEVLDLLVNKYKIASPDEGMWFDDFIDARKKIKSGIEELFVADANNSF